MDFIGSGRRLAQGDVGDAARWLGVETPVLLAFMEVETAGRGFDARNRPKMLFEPHVFWRELGAGSARAKAEAQGLAYAKWGARPYPKDSYPRLGQALGISDKALRSASWGLGQILGSNHGAAGHPTPLAMIEAAMQGEKEQLWSMVALMKGWGMQPMLSGADFTTPDAWRPAARKWNGSAYATHNYHGRMAAAYIKHTKGEPMSIPTPETVILMRGQKGEAVRALQADLQSLGHVFVHGIDGRYGEETERNVQKFQASVGLDVDGRAGPATRKAIAQALARATADATPPPPVWPGQEETKKPAPIPVEPLPPRQTGPAPGPVSPAVIVVMLVVIALALAGIWLLSGV